MVLFGVGVLCYRAGMRGSIGETVTRLWRDCIRDPILHSLHGTSIIFGCTMLVIKDFNGLEIRALG